MVSDLICPPLPPPPLSARFALQPLHRFGSFLKPLSAKNICSPDVNTNSAPHSEHFRTLSWNSMCRFPLDLDPGDAHSLHDRLWKSGIPVAIGNRAGSLEPAGTESASYFQTSLPDRGLNHGGGAEPQYEQDYSCSRRCFLRKRFRESASLARRFSPGFI